MSQKKNGRFSVWRSRLAWRCGRGRIRMEVERRAEPVAVLGRIRSNQKCIIESVSTLLSRLFSSLDNWPLRLSGSTILTSSSGARPALQRALPPRSAPPPPPRGWARTPAPRPLAGTPPCPAPPMHCPAVAAAGPARHHTFNRRCGRAFRNAANLRSAHRRGERQQVLGAHSIRRRNILHVPRTKLEGDEPAVLGARPVRRPVYQRLGENPAPAVLQTVSIGPNAEIDES